MTKYLCIHLLYSISFRHKLWYQRTKWVAQQFSVVRQMGFLLYKATKYRLRKWTMYILNISTVFHILACALRRVNIINCD